MRIQKIVALTALPLFSAALLTACSSTSVEVMCEVAADHEENLMAATQNSNSDFEAQADSAEAMVEYYDDLEDAAPDDIKGAVTSSKETWEQLKEHLEDEDLEAVGNVITAEDALQNQQDVYEYMEPSCGDLQMFGGQ